MFRADNGLSVCPPGEDEIGVLGVFGLRQFFFFGWREANSGRQGVG